MEWDGRKEEVVVTKQAKVNWKGDLEHGVGSIQNVGSGSIGPLDVSWPARTGDEAGMTSPEELIAAAHAACFSMALSNVLNEADTPPDQLDVTADVTFVPGTGITASALHVSGVVPGITPKAFAEAAENAKDNCPVSSALKGNVEMTVDARLAV
jgi:lipoyl-dependent peroxiredoxin